MAQTFNYSIPEFFMPVYNDTVNSYRVDFKIDFHAVYDVDANTSDWTANIYIRQHEVPLFAYNTGGSFKYQITFPIWETDESPNSSLSLNDYAKPVLKGSAYTGNLTGDWKLLASPTLGGIKHNSSRGISASGWNEYVDVGSTRKSFKDYFEIRIEGPTNSMYDDFGQSSPEYATATSELYKKITWICKKYENSTITATHANIGEASTITILNGQDGGLLHTVYYSVDGGTTINQVGSAYRTDRQFSWIIPDELYAQIPNDKRGIVHVYVDTFDEGRGQIGTRQYTTLWGYTVYSECKPTLSPTIHDVNPNTIALTGDKNKIIPGKSYAEFTANATARKSSTITRVEVINGSQSIVKESGTFWSVFTNKFTFHVTDSRGYVTEVTYSPSSVPYVQLSCIVEAEAPTADGIMSFIIKGNYYNGSFGVVNNILEVKYRIKEINQEYGAWVTVTPEISGTTYQKTITLTGMDYLSSYTIEAYAVDKFGRVDANNQAVATLPIFDWGVNDFNMNVPMTVYGSLTVNGDVTVTGTINGEEGAGGGTGLCFGLCETAAATQAKLVTCGTFTDLIIGASIRVKFAYGNVAVSPTMNVNGTGPISIMRYGNSADPGYGWYAGEVKDFVFDGTYWIMVDGGLATTSYYGKTKLTDIISDDSFTALTPRAVYDMGIESGPWTPTLGTAAAVSSYSVRQGWYQKIGNVVTIGFNVTVATNSGHHGTAVSITGVPYNPKYAAFGGGVAYNIYTPANYIFEGWNIDGNGKITARTQTSNKTADGNLSIGTNAYYAYNGANMTLSGTITYTTE